MDRDPFSTFDASGWFGYPKDLAQFRVCPSVVTTAEECGKRTRENPLRFSNVGFHSAPTHANRDCFPWECFRTAGTFCGVHAGFVEIGWEIKDRDVYIYSKRGRD